MILEDAQISVYDHLVQYKNDPLAYIQFTNDVHGDISSSNVLAPYGIFAYPLKLTWKLYEVDHFKSFKKFPYATNNAYISLLSYNLRNVIDTVKYKNFDEDYKKLYDKYSHIINVAKLLENLDKTLNEPSDFDLLYKFTLLLAKEIHKEDYLKAWAHILKVLNYDCIIDTIGKINKSESVIALILNIDKIKHIDTFLNKDYRKINVERYISNEKELIYMIEHGENIRRLLTNLSPHLIGYLQQWLESKNHSGSLFEFLNDRRKSDSDVKILLIIWLNSHVNIRIIDGKLKNLLELFGDSDILKYAQGILGNAINAEILKHNIALIKTV